MIAHQTIKFGVDICYFIFVYYFSNVFFLYFILRFFLYIDIDIDVGIRFEEKKNIENVQSIDH